MDSYLKFLVIFGMLAAPICHAQSQEIEIEEDDTQTISCLANHEIVIQSSQSSWRWGNPLTTPTSCVFGGCTYDMTEKVKELCNGLGSCIINPTSHFFGYYVLHYRRFLRVDYQCRPCPPTRKRRQTGFETFVPVQFGVCNLNAKLPSNFNNCPNHRFVAKHVCSNCYDADLSAAMFAHQVANIRNHGNTVSTDFNSVFIAPHMDYNQNGDHCFFNWRVPKYNCQLNRNTRGWDCTPQGKVIATHSASDGHYHHHLDY